MVIEFISSGDISIVKAIEELLKFSIQLMSHTPHGNWLPELSDVNPCDESGTFPGDEYVDELMLMSDFTGHQYS